MDYLPVFAKLAGRSCLVVGGGDVAARKVRMLRKAGASVTVNAPELGAELVELEAAGEIRFIRGSFQPTLVARQFLIIAATNDEEVNRRVFETAESQGRLVNTVDDRKKCSFISPSVVDRSPLVVAVSTGGTAPVLARMLRERLEAWLPTRLGRLAELASGLRDRVRKVFARISDRRQFWERVFEGPAAEHVYAGRTDRAMEHIDRLLGATDESPPGEVALVGAGPGDPALLTLRALQVMQRADVILHDQLVPQEILDLARRDAEFVDVGKKAGGHRTRQEHINTLLIDYARQGLKVCRLKGGDPFIFGRGGEELQALAAAGIPFQVVPGITAASGCAAYSGIPLTHRDLSHSVSFVTAHCRKSLDCLDWENLAREKHTLVFYMPIARLGALRTNLIANGRDEDTPVAIVERGTTTRQRVITATLATLEDAAADVESPALLIVGEVTALHSSLGWFGADKRTTSNEALTAVQSLGATG